MKSCIGKSSSGVQKVNILLVDDRPENLIALEALLDSPNYRLFSANSGEEALRHVLSENFAVILLDVQMPGLNGFQTASLIKSREKSKQIPIIFITAISQAVEHVKHGYTVGAIDYIFKPFHPETLKMKIEAFVKMHQYQEQIKLQNELLKAIGETSSDTIVTTDEEGAMLTVSPAVAAMFGYLPEDLTGYHIDRLVPALFSCFSDGKEFMETTGLRKDEGRFPCDVQVGEASIEDRRIVVFSIRDVTERKLMEEERFRKIFDAMPSLISLRSLKDRKYINVNKSLLNAIGYRQDEVINQTEDVLSYIFDSNESGISEDMSELQKPSKNVRISYMTKSSDMREGLLSTEMMHIHGEPCLLSVITDITDQVLFEKEMVRLDRLNLTGEMAAGIIHEIRNPMTTVRGFLQLSKSRPSSEHTDIMIEELDRAHNIVTEFLAVANTNPTNRKVKQLNAVIEVLFPLIHSKALCANHDIRLELGQCPSLQLDEKEIRQLLLNLVLNGLDAMPSGGTLTIRTYKEDNEVILEVQDQGCGIKEELIPKLGTPFFSTKAGGTGLGLSVCYGVAKRHDAVIKVKTSEQGTIFLVHFRLHPLMK